MKQLTSSEEKDNYTAKMTRSLPVLRATLGITQQELGRLVGVTRQTIAAVENWRRPLTWTLYLAIAYVMEQDPRTNNMMRFLQVSAESDEPESGVSSS
ncbi:MAG: helix-turn-helix domain-containing protein [Clostridiales bacterium]|jgi:DNA-binding XRE family transcriptional regulator|nr:helix-turn-helix domain-containing protein [Clostridiales bacterium]